MHLPRPRLALPLVLAVSLTLILGQFQAPPIAQSAATTNVILDIPTVPYDINKLPFASNILPFPAALNGPVLITPTISLSTTAAISMSAGFVVTPTLVPNLSRTDGYTVSFTSRLLSETHSSNDRAGLSVLVLGDDSTGIELGFWTDRVWAQNDGPTVPPLFTQGEGVTFTTTSLITYDLTIKNAGYRLLANNTEILSGNLRDYRAFAEISDSIYKSVYTSTNVVFVGDDTSQASASFQLTRLAIATGPSLPTIILVNPNSGPTSGGNLIGISGTNLTGASVTIGGQPATVQSSSATSLTLTVPPGIAGAANVVVTNAEGSVTAPNGYTYVGPTATATAPSPTATTIVTGTTPTATATTIVPSPTSTTIVTGTAPTATATNTSVPLTVTLTPTSPNAATATATTPVAATATATSPNAATATATTPIAATATATRTTTPTATLPPIAGNFQIAGKVYNEAAATGNEVAGALVEICAGNICQTTTSGSDGSYQFGNLAAGSYTLRALPPAGNNHLIGNLGPISLVANIPLLNQNILLPKGAEMPAGTGITPAFGTIDGVPIIFWNTSVLVTQRGCPGGTATYKVYAYGTLVRTGAMTEAPAGTFSAQLAPFVPLHGTIQVEVDIQCSNGPQPPVVFNIWIDPSGLVVNTQGQPISDATVSLYRADAASGPFELVPSGSAIMSPANRVNPMKTGSDGAFGWDVIAGYYRVRAEKAGCTAPGSSKAFNETAVLTIPPPVTDLRIVLFCGESQRVFLSLLHR